MQTPDDLKAPEPGNPTGLKFMSLFLALAVKPDVLPRFLVGYQHLPYDAYCPSVQSLLTRVSVDCSMPHCPV